MVNFSILLVIFAWALRHCSLQHQCASLSPVHTGDKVEFNTVDFVISRLLPKLATNQQQSRLLPYNLRSTVLPVLATNRQQREFDSLSRSTLLLIRSTLLPIRSTLLPVCTGPKQHGRLCRLSTKSTVLNATLSPVRTGVYRQYQQSCHLANGCKYNVITILFHTAIVIIKQCKRFRVNFCIINTY